MGQCRQLRVDLATQVAENSSVTTSGGGVSVMHFGLFFGKSLLYFPDNLDYFFCYLQMRLHSVKDKVSLFFGRKVKMLFKMKRALLIAVDKL